MNNPYPDYYPQSQQGMAMPVTSDEVYASELQREIVKNIIAQLDPGNQLDKIQMALKGYRKNEHTQEWIKINPNGKEPHPELVEKLMGRLVPLVSQSMTMAFLSEKQVNMMMHRFIGWLNDFIDNNSEKYGIDDESERTRICDIMLDAAFPNLTRALNGRESTRIFKAISLSEYNGGDNGGNKKKSMLDYLKM